MILLRWMPCVTFYGSVQMKPHYWTFSSQKYPHPPIFSLRYCPLNEARFNDAQWKLGPSLQSNQLQLKKTGFRKRQLLTWLITDVPPINFFYNHEMRWWASVITFEYNLLSLNGAIQKASSLLYTSILWGRVFPGRGGTFLYHVIGSMKVGKPPINMSI